MPIPFFGAGQPAAASGGSALELSAGPGDTLSVHDMVLDGTILYVVGSFTQVTDRNGTYTRNRAAALNTVTNLWTSWNPSVNGIVRAVAVDSEGVILGGAFSEIGFMISRFRLAKVNKTTGGNISTFTSPISTGTEVRGLALNGSDLFVVGDVTVTSPSRSHLFKVNAATGAVVSAFTCNANQPSRVVRVLAGNLYIGGPFTTLNGTARNCLGACDLTTGAITSFNPFSGLSLGANARVDDIVYDGSEWFYVCGYFTESVSYNFIGTARVKADNTVTPNWNPYTENNALTDWPCLLYDGGGLYVGSTVIGPSSDRLGIARFSTPATPTLDSAFNVNLGNIGEAPPIIQRIARLDATYGFIGGMFWHPTDSGRKHIMRINMATGAQA